MPIFNNLDVGMFSLNQGPNAGQLAGRSVIQGSRTITWGQAGKAQQRVMVVNVQAPFAIGGAAAGSRQAVRYAVQQLLEMANNPDMNPVYVQWESGHGVLTPNPYDGWYILEDVTPLDYRYNTFVPCQLTATFVATGPPMQPSLSYRGGAMASNFSGTALNLLSLPVGSTSLEAGFTRAGAEGAIPCIPSPAASVEPLVLPATIAQIFQGGVHVYDTINTGTNPVPTTGGTFVNANWVEIFGTDHDFVGDCVITNGLLLLLFTAGANTRIFLPYVWNTGLAVANWQNAGGVGLVDNALHSSTARSFSLARVGAEECSITVALSGSTPMAQKVTVRLQRGRYDCRIDVRELTESNTGNLLFYNAGASYTPKISYNEANATDVAVGAVSLAATAIYGYAAVFGANSGVPILAGLLYQNAAAFQPAIVNTSDIRLGDTSGPAINAQRSYGFFAIPYGVSGSYSTANLQAEAESGTLGTGWTSQANAAASGGNEAKCASGTLATNADLFGTAFVPDPGTYDVWFRIKVTTNVGSNAEMTVGLWNSTDSVFVPSGSTTFNRTAMTTGYLWYRAATGVTPTAAKSMRFRAVTALTLGTDWFIDEAVLVPKTLTNDNRGPQDIFQQWLFDRDVRMDQGA